METATGSLREREAAVAAVSRCLEKAEAGEGNALFLLGWAGLGKTSLLEHAARTAIGFVPARARGERMEAVIPFGVAEQLFASLPGDAEGSLLGERPAIEASVPYMRLLRRVESGAGQPLLILLDDLHWADRDSLNLLAFLARRIARLPVAIIAALRPWPKEALEAVRGLERHGAGLQRLAPLGRESTGEILAGGAAGPLPGALVEHAWRLSGGNPLLIDLIAQILIQGGELPEVGEPSDSGEETPLAQGLLLSRFAGLDEVSMSLARCAAVAGVSFRVDIAVAAAGLEAGEAEPALEALFRSGLVVDDKVGRMRFAHPLFEQALYAGVAPPVRTRLHARIFELLVERGFEREAADHAIRGEMIGHKGAAEVLERTGTAALTAGAVATAADKLGWAVRMHADVCPPHLLLLCARALVAGGHAAEAATMIERLLASEDRLDWRDEVEALRTLGQAGYLSGAQDLGDRHLNAAVEITERHDRAAAVRPLLDQTSVAWMAAGPIAALPLAARARTLATDGPAELKLAADALWGHLAVESGDQSGWAAVEPVGALLAAGDTERLLDPAELVWPAAAVYGYAHTAKYAERLDESLRALELAREALLDAGAVNGAATVTLFIGNQLVRRGRLEQALLEADRAEEFSELTPLTRPFASLIRAEALAWMGRFEESAAACEAAHRQTPPPGLWAVRIWSGLIRGQCMLWRGDAGASDHFLEVERQADEVGLSEPSSQPWIAYAVEAHLAAGRRDQALRLTEWLERFSAGSSSRWAASVAAFHRGRIFAYDGRPDRAEAAYREAIERLGEIDLPLLKARILLALGGLIRREGRLVDARRPLAEAIQLAESLGADQVVERAASELRLAGGRRRRPTTQRDVLTPAERRVAVEIAAGLTNAEAARRLHVSVNTVATHLKRVYLKLGIHSRRELIELGIGAESDAGRDAARSRPEQTSRRGRG